MARKSEEKASTPKEPGRIKQMWQVFQMTRRYDKSIVWIMLLGFLIPVAAGLAVALLLSDGNGFAITMWIIAGVLAGFLIALIILGRRAERAAYGQIAGQPGAVGAVLRSSLKRSWRAARCRWP